MAKHTPPEDLATRDWLIWLRWCDESLKRFQKDKAYAAHRADIALLRMTLTEVLSPPGEAPTTATTKRKRTKKQTAKSL